MTPEEYTQEIVVPTLREYFADVQDRRKALLACLTLIHLHDALKENERRPVKESAAEFFESLKTECPECWAVYLVGISAKHMRHNKSGFAIDEVVRRPPAFYGTAVYGLSRYDDFVGGVEAMSLGASVDHSLRIVFEFLSKSFLKGVYNIDANGQP